MLGGYFVNLIQVRVIWEERISVKIASPTNWPVGKLLLKVHFIEGCFGGGGGPGSSLSDTPKQVVHGCIRKQAKPAVGIKAVKWCACVSSALVPVSTVLPFFSSRYKHQSSWDR